MQQNLKTSLKICEDVKNFYLHGTKYWFSTEVDQDFHFGFGNVNYWKSSSICDQADFPYFHPKRIIFNNKVPPNLHTNASRLLHPLILVILPWPPQSIQLNYASVLLCLLLSRYLSPSETMHLIFFPSSIFDPCNICLQIAPIKVETHTAQKHGCADAFDSS